MIDRDGRLMTKNGTLQIGNTDEQNMQAAILSHKGEFKEYPLVGADIENYLKTAGKELEMLRQVKIQLALVGYPNAGVKFVDGELIIN
jgi:hypothetical protein